MSDGNTENIKDILKTFIENQRYKKRLQATRIDALWKELMGETVMPYTNNLRFQKGTLYISLTSAALREELNRGKEKIRQLMNQHLGEEIIEKIVFK